MRIEILNPTPFLTLLFQGDFKMELRQKLLELTAEDGPNIPARTLAIYCGVSSTTLIQYKNGKVGLSKTLYE